MKIRIIYGILFRFPRAFLNLIDDLVTIITLGFYSPELYFRFKVGEHSIFAYKIAKKF